MSQFFLIGFILASFAGSQPFADPAGDSGTAPDVVQVVASSADTGLLTFAITASNAATWTNAGASLMVDSDANYATGHNDGVDYLFTLHRDHTFEAGRWNGRDNFDPYGSAATHTLNGATLTITVPVHELGNTQKLAFAVLTFDAGNTSDQAPDGSFAPGTPPRWQFSPQITPRVVALTATFSSRSPRHGARFAVRRVTARLSTGDTRVMTASCTAKIGPTKLAGRCSWRIPDNARGQKLLVIVRAGAVSRAYRLRVR
jgi:hypothetical protein